MKLHSLAPSKVLGVMPVQRGKIGRITFSWISVPSLYAYIFYAFTSTLVVLVGYERLIILTKKSKEFDEYIYSIIFVVYLVPHFWIPYVGWGVAKEVCDYKNSWGDFQLYYYKITGDNVHETKQLNLGTQPNVEPVAQMDFKTQVFWGSWS